MPLKDTYHAKEPNPQESLDRKRTVEYRKLFSSETGRWVLLDMCKQHKVLVGIAPTNLDPQALAYSAGAQAVLTDILARINKNPMELRQEMAESNG